jgi:integrase
MAICSYEKNGETFYRAIVHNRSSKFHDIRVQRSKSALKTLVEARREEKKLTRQVIEEVASIEAKGITWKELILRWERLALNGLVDKHYPRHVIKENINTLYNHTDLWFHKRVRELSRSDGRYLINLLEAEKYSLSSIKRVKYCVNKIWTWAVEEGLITEQAKSPLHGIYIRVEKNQYRPILTLDEIRKLLFEAELRDHPWKDIWATAIMTGMRSGELVALTWDDVDFDNNIIRITKSYSPKIKGVKSTKNAEWRNAHISQELRKVLLRLRSIEQDENRVMPKIPSWRSGHAGRILKEFLHRIGIERNVTFHTLRACFATHVLASGVEPTKVMKMGGWSDFKTFQIYVRMAGVDVKGTTDKLHVTPDFGSLDNVVRLQK